MPSCCLMCDVTRVAKEHLVAEHKAFKFLFMYHVDGVCASLFGDYDLYYEMLIKCFFPLSKISLVLIK